MNKFTIPKGFCQEKNLEDTSKHTDYTSKETEPSNETIQKILNYSKSLVSVKINMLKKNTLLIIN